VIQPAPLRKPLYSDAGSGVIFNLSGELIIGNQVLPEGVIMLPTKKISEDIVMAPGAELAGIRFLPSDFAYPRLIVLGGSEGAPVANLLAAELNTIDATVAFNGGGRMFIDDVLHSIRTGAASSEEAAKAAQGFLGFSNHVLSSEPSDLEVSGHGYRWWHQMLSIDQLNVLKAVNTPLLVIQGGLDTSVSPDEVNEMIESLRKVQKDNIDFIPYENLDHTFNDEQEVSHQDEVVEDIRQWLKSKLI
jgi:pimeloyl-ACP methyl ester carboxylesterase|tara:strand:- start:3652 stop:4389 length:738 start_codon:yes stop_codon:yes gene_type:complete